ncbi:hypothetical protein D3C86_1805630 [compost metagenome]
MSFDLFRELVYTTHDPLIEWILEHFTRISKITLKFPTINLSVHREEVIHIPDHTKLTCYITNFFIL